MHLNISHLYYEWTKESSWKVKSNLMIVEKAFAYEREGSDGSNE